MARDMRINQAIAASGLCSRRKADELVAQGRVKVNGELLGNPGLRVTQTDVIEVDGRRLEKSENIYLMLHKPIMTVCTAHDPQGRQTVLDLLPPDIRASRVFPVGRLDYFSEGLLVLTNDGALAQRLAHPRHEKRKLYEVLIRGPVSKTQVQRMQSGMTLKDGTRLPPVRARAKKTGDNTLLELELRQGINRQIRRMCADLELVILKLRRVALGSLRLGDLPRGKWRKLTAKEVAALQDDSKSSDF